MKKHEPQAIRKTRTYQSLVHLMPAFTTKTRSPGGVDELLEVLNEEQLTTTTTASTETTTIAPTMVGQSRKNREDTIHGYPPKYSDGGPRTDESNLTLLFPQNGKHFAPESGGEPLGFPQRVQGTVSSQIRNSHESWESKTATRSDSHHKNQNKTLTIHEDNAAAMNSSPSSTYSISPQGYQRRSCAIAIKRQNSSSYNYTEQNDLLIAEEEETNERMYDWATWRMYNRIIDHRRNQHLTPRSGSQESLVTSPPVQETFPTTNLAVDTFSNDYIHDGEVFELDI